MCGAKAALADAWAANGRAASEAGTRLGASSPGHKSFVPACLQLVSAMVGMSAKRIFVDVVACEHLGYPIKVEWF